MTRYRRGAIGSGRRMIALAGGLMTGAVTYYLTSLWLSREPIDPVEANRAEEGDAPPRRGDEESSSDAHGRASGSEDREIER